MYYSSSNVLLLIRSKGSTHVHKRRCEAGSHSTSRPAECLRLKRAHAARSPTRSRRHGTASGDELFPCRSTRKAWDRSTQIPCSAGKARRQCCCRFAAEALRWRENGAASAVRSCAEWSRSEARRSPSGRREHDRSLSHRRPAAMPMVSSTWGLPAQIASLFWRAHRRALAYDAAMLYVASIEFRPNDLAPPRTMRRTDDLPPNLEHNRAARLCSLPVNAPERRVI
jgi:hypothetical protein